MRHWGVRAGALIGALLLTLAFVLPVGAEDLAGDLNQDSKLTVADLVLALRMLSGNEAVDLSRVDLNVDGRLAVDDVLLLARRVIGLDDQSTASPWLGGRLEAEDGASVDLPAQSVSAGTTVQFQKVEEATGEIHEERVVISGVYELEVGDPAAISGEVQFQVPVDLSLLPQGMTEDDLRAGLVVEQYDSTTDGWVVAVTGAAPEYDSSTGSVWFDAMPFPGDGGGASPSAATSGSVRAAPGPNTRQYRVTPYYFGWGSMVYTTLPQSNFTISYYPPALKKAYSVVDDTIWGSPSGAGSYLYANVPDYIEDLDRALNQAYQYLLAIQRSSGGSVFSAVSTPIEIYVTDLGGANGNTSLGGLGGVKIDKNMPGKIVGLTRLDMLKATAAHELVHVLQGAHYTLWGAIRGRSDRWLIDATAQYYGALAAGFGSGRRAAYWTSLSDDYLGVSITSSNEESFYAVAHFLDWLSRTYKGNIPGDALFQGKSSALLDLGRAIQLQGGLGLTSAFGEYLDAIVRQPEELSKSNGEIKEQLRKHTTLSYLSTSKLFFREQGGLNFIRLKKNLAPLSAAYLYIRADNQNPGLLVIDPSASAEIEFEWLALDFIGAKNSDYQGKRAVSDGISFLSARTAPPTIPDFGKNGASRGMEFLIADNGTSFHHDADVSFYLLQAPEITDVDGSNVTWSTSRRGNIPDQYIAGYSVSVNGISKGSIPVLAGAGVPSELSLEVPNLTPSDNVVVHVIDRYGNTWPELKTPNAPAFTSFQVDLEWDRATVALTVESDAPLNELAYTFNSGSEVDILEAGTSQRSVLSAANSTQRQFEIDLSQLPNGSYPLQVKATDSNGFTSSRDETIVIDDVGPNFTTVDIQVQQDTATVQVEAYSKSPLTELTYAFNSGAAVSILSSAALPRVGTSEFWTSRTFSLDLSNLADGSYPLNLSAVDSRGLTGSTSRDVVKGGPVGGPYISTFNVSVGASVANASVVVSSESPLQEVTYSFAYSGPFQLDCPSPSTPDPNSGEYITHCSFAVDVSGLLCGEFSLEVAATDSEDRTGTSNRKITRDEGDCDKEGDARDFLPGVWLWTWTKTSSDNDPFYGAYHEDDVRIDISGSKLIVTDWGTGTPLYLGEYSFGGGGIGFVATRQVGSPEYGYTRYEIRGTFKQALMGAWGWYWEGAATVTDVTFTETGDITKTYTYALTGSKLGN